MLIKECWQLRWFDDRQAYERLFRSKTEMEAFIEKVVADPRFQDRWVCRNLSQ